MRFPQEKYYKKYYRSDLYAFFKSAKMQIILINEGRKEHIALYSLLNSIAFLFSSPTYPNIRTGQECESRQGINICPDAADVTGIYRSGG